MRLELLGLGGVHLAVADQDHDVAGVHQAGRGAVDAEHAAAALARDRVGLEPRAVGDVDDVHELAGQQVGGVEEVLVDGDRADVVQVRLGHGGPVDLALHHGPQHQGVPPRSEWCVVDQAGGADAGGDEHPRLGAGRHVGGQLAQVGVGDHQVVEVDLRGACAARRGQPPSARSSAVRRVGLRPGEGAVQDGRLEPLLVVEVAVAAGQREAVGLPLGLGAHDLDRQAEVGDHLPDQHELLVVLLAEDRDVGPDQAEQLGHHGEHAAEVAGPDLALEHVRERSGLDGHRRLLGPARVDLLDGRGEDDVDALLLADLEVEVEGARVAVEVLAGAELERVDEHRGDHDPRPARGRPASGWRGRRAARPWSARARRGRRTACPRRAASAARSRCATSAGWVVIAALVGRSSGQRPRRAARGSAGRGSAARGRR